MKIIIFLFLFALVSPQIVLSQANTYLSNLGQTSIGSLAAGSDSWYATLFETGNNAGGYELNSLQLEMTDASGNPNGFSVMLLDANGIPGAISPGNDLGNLTGSLNPTHGDIFAYAPTSNLILSPHTLYFIAITSGTPIATGAYDWSVSGTFNYNPTGGWPKLTGVATSTDGSSWIDGSGGVYPQYAITATPIPEPSAEILLGFGGILFFGVGHWRKKIA